MTSFASGPIIIDVMYDEFKRIYICQLSGGTCKTISKETIEDYTDCSAFAAAIRALVKT